MEHDVDYLPMDQIVEEAPRTLRGLQEAGKARFVGITGFPPNLQPAASYLESLGT